MMCSVTQNRKFIDILLVLYIILLSRKQFFIMKYEESDRIELKREMIDDLDKEI